MWTEKQKLLHAYDVKSINNSSRCSSRLSFFFLINNLKCSLRKNLSLPGEPKSQAFLVHNQRKNLLGSQFGNLRTLNCPPIIFSYVIVNFTELYCMIAEKKT